MNPLQLLKDISANLRWLQFPNNANEVFANLDNLYKTYRSSNIKWNPDYFIEFINQFVFNIPAENLDMKISRLNRLQNLQLAEMLLSFLSYPAGNEDDRQNIFYTIFNKHGYYKGDFPLIILSMVTSLALATKNADVLNSIAYWMISVGLDSPSVQYIASDITKDLIHEENPDKHNFLYNTSFLFNASLLIAIGKLFLKQIPHPRLKKKINLWIEGCPSVCFIPPHSVIFEIFRWVLLSPEDEAGLHCAILNSIDKAGRGGQFQVIPPVLTLIQDLKFHQEYLIANNSNNHEMVRTSNERNADRLYQLIQILIGSKCLDLNEIDAIFDAIESAKIPSTIFYDILKRNIINNN